MEEAQNPEVVSESEKPSVLKTLHTVTPFSKYLAMALFIILPFLGGWIGYNLAPEKMVEVERVVVQETETVADAKTIFTTDTNFSSTIPPDLLGEWSQYLDCPNTTFTFHEDNTVDRFYCGTIDNPDKLEEVDMDSESGIYTVNGNKIVASFPESGELEFQLIKNEDDSNMVLQRLDNQDFVFYKVDRTPDIEDVISISDIDSAEKALLAFFTYLNRGLYEDAVSLYAGSYGFLEDWNPDLDKSDKAALLAGGCEHNGLNCLEVGEVIKHSVISPTEEKFVVTLKNDDGSTFDSFYSETDEWEYTVTEHDGNYSVTGLPPYTP